MIHPDTLARLSQVSTATITTQLFNRGLRNTHLAGLRPLEPTRATLIGEAFTLRTIPAREDLEHPRAYDDYDHPQRVAIETVGTGQVLVIDSRGQGRAASAGEILLARLVQRGVVGVVTDGTLRDTAAIRELPLPVHAAGSSPMTNLAQHHVVDSQVPIGCAGVAIYPGDVIVADDDGVVCIPRHLADEIAVPAAEQERLERFIRERIDGGAPLRGTYPPDERTREQYTVWGRDR